MWSWVLILYEIVMLVTNWSEARNKTVIPYCEHGENSHGVHMIWTWAQINSSSEPLFVTWRASALTPPASCECYCPVPRCFKIVRISSSSSCRAFTVQLFMYSCCYIGCCGYASFFFLISVLLGTPKTLAERLGQALLSGLTLLPDVPKWCRSSRL